MHITHERWMPCATGKSSQVKTVKSGTRGYKSKDETSLWLQRLARLRIGYSGWEGKRWLLGGVPISTVRLHTHRFWSF